MGLYLHSPQTENTYQGPKLVLLSLLSSKYSDASSLRELSSTDNLHLLSAYKTSGGSRGEAREPAPLFFDQKKFLETPPPPVLSQGLDLPVKTVLDFGFYAKDFGIYNHGQKSLGQSERNFNRPLS